MRYFIRASVTHFHLKCCGSVKQPWLIKISEQSHVYRCLLCYDQKTPIHGWCDKNTTCPHFPVTKHNYGAIWCVFLRLIFS